MNREQIRNLIKSLGKSKGFYTRLFNSLFQMKQDEPEKFDSIMENLESQNFKDDLDFIMYMEG